MFSSIGTLISNYTRVIFAVLGLMSLYPNVEITNVRVVEKNRAIYAEFRTKSLINEYLFQIIDSGIDVYYTIEATTYLISEGTEKRIYQNTVIKKISRMGNIYLLDNEICHSTEELVSKLNNTQILIFPPSKTTSKITRGSSIRTTITLKIFSNAVPNLMNLWGNKPNIVLNYRINED